MKICVALSCALAAAPLAAQTPQPVRAVMTTGAPIGTAILRTGTPVPLRLTEELTTEGKKLRVGQRFHLETAEAILVDGQTVIPAGSPAMGEISDVRNKGMWGRSGHLGARVLYVTANGRQIRLSGSFDDKGVAGGMGAAAMSALVFLPAGFFMTGTSARVPVGAPVKGFVDEDVALAGVTPPVVAVAANAPPVIALVTPPPVISTPPASSAVPVATVAIPVVGTPATQPTARVAVAAMPIVAPPAPTVQRAAAAVPVASVPVLRPVQAVAVVAAPTMIPVATPIASRSLSQRDEYDQLLVQGFSPVAARLAVESKFGFRMN